MTRMNMWHRVLIAAAFALVVLCGLTALPQASAYAATGSVYLNAITGNDANDGSTPETAVATYAKAKELAVAAAASEGAATIEAASFDVANGIEVPSGITLKVTEDAALAGAAGSTQPGITVLTGGHLTVAAGKTLSFTGYDTSSPSAVYALKVHAGGEVNDGAYSFSNLKWAYYLDGSFKGTDRSALTVTVNATDRGIEWTGTAQHINATINATVKSNSADNAGDGGHHDQLFARDSSITFKGVAMVLNRGLGMQLSGSTLSVEGKFYRNFLSGYRTLAIASNTASVLDGSTLIVRGGFFSVTSGAGFTVRNGSTVHFAKDSTGASASACMNVNYTSWARFENSTLSSEIGAPLAGEWQGANQIYFTGNSVVNTDASNSQAAIGMRNAGSSYEVTGGSFLLYPVAQYDMNIPVNGADHGNEKLGYFTLSDASVTSLNAIDKNGVAYSYPVANASSDGNKYVWMPKATVAFYRDKADIASGAAAYRTLTAMRGEKLALVSRYQDQSVAMPSDPTAAAKTFAGWFYEDANGAEHEFTDATPIPSNLKVYAKWEADPNAAAVTYHVNLGGSEQYVDNVQRVEGDTQSAVAQSTEDLSSRESAFNQPTMTFEGWNTAADGSGTAYQPGDTVTFSGQTVDLYAIWQDIPVTVTFSANGGTFAADSVFKKYSADPVANPEVDGVRTNPVAFTIIADDRGGEAAVLNATGATMRNPKRLSTMLSEASNGKLSTSTPGISTDLSENQNAGSAYQTIKHGATKPHQVIDATSYNLWGTDYYHFWFDSPTDQTEGTAAAFGYGDNYGDAISRSVTFYLKWAEDPSVQRIEATVSMNADMWSVSADHSDAIRSVRKDMPFSVTGAIDISVIRQQVLGFRQQYYPESRDGSDILLDGINSTFTATLTLPEGVSLSEPLESSASASGYKSLFKDPVFTQEGNVITVTYQLKEGIDTFKKLEEALANAGAANESGLRAARVLRAAAEDSTPTISSSDRIETTISNLVVNDPAGANDEIYTLPGVLTGNFEAYASRNDTTMHFVLGWNGTQLAGASDAGSTSAPISASVRLAAPIGLTLPGDLLVGTDTQHEEGTPVFVHRGDTFTAAGKLDISSIRSQILAIAAPFGNTDGIGIDLHGSTFKATLTLPEQVEIPAGLQASSSDMNGLFEVADTQVEGQVVTVTLKLVGRNDDGSGPYDTFDSLNAAVQQAGDANGWITVSLPGLTVKQDAAFGSQFILRGAVTGDFWATASKQQNDGTVSHEYDFRWNAVQWDEGTDGVTGDASAITLTMEVEQRRANAIAKYVDADSGEEISDSVTTEYGEGEAYSTEAKAISGYELVATPANASGTMGASDVTVTYEYRQVKHALTVKHVDADTGEALADPVTSQLAEGAAYSTEPIEPAGYELVATPANASGTMGTSDVTVTYEYRKIPVPPAKHTLIVKHLVEGTDAELAPTETSQIEEGAEYTTSAKTFEGYELTAMPSNFSGVMGASDVTVVYRYRPVAAPVAKHTLTVKHVDAESGANLIDPASSELAEGAEYATQPIEPAGYTLVATPANASGAMGTSDVTVTYEYKKAPQPVKRPLVVRYLIEGAGGELVPAEMSEVVEGATYSTQPKQIEGYELVAVQGNPSGTMSAAGVTVTYEYRKIVVAPTKHTLTVKHVDADTGKDLADQVVSQLAEGDPYATEPKQIEGYELVATPTNASGTMGTESITVTYEYRVKAKAPVKPEPEPEPEPKPNEPVAEPETTPHTGDEAPLAVALAALVGGGAAAFAARRKAASKR